ncbi:methionyl-tRNA formyltransferase [Thauera linaloolentis]|uniref:Methionyl-tRNA formyltransferase n=1 Tax=Thauera linaloolentis (strain DSM 12138 / JCM 21573 / CCUG 41526 / CIP 105981 / IAM 15112 / NBRC 102519 / 47Lol) TaxID=1123367 RepID=N6ZAF2_THAL4|nr:methionyl-tRNA formyltransferase [Thauera linaloolentis]ENO89174.1 methionyl-tRNA formyltransferase [Thauera linaloolentis 47Lol = DSM 12138]MCM8567294.1 methionyl-tRNA formyltransferase [Thauera linaloolentis]
MTAAPLRVAFAGTPEFAACALDAILAAGHQVPLVLTQPDRPAGRGMKLTPSPVKQLALGRGIEVDQPEKLRTDAQRARLVACAPDVLVVAAYGLILPRAVLDLPRLGCINIHASLLPRWRGAAPIHRAIEAGDAETGITIMQMDEGLDTGAMLLKRSLPILPRDTTATLHDRLAVLGGECIAAALAAPDDLVPVPQPAEGASYAAKIGRAEAAADWNRPAAELERAMRAFDPFPGLASSLRGTVVKFWSAEAVDAEGEPGSVLAADGTGIVVACGRGALRCTVLQRPGSRRLPAGEFLRGFAVSVGECFASGEAGPA